MLRNENEAEVIKQKEDVNTKTKETETSKPKDDFKVLRGKLNKQPKEKIKIMLDSNDLKQKKAGKKPTVPICINGYVYQIEKGIEVEVPKPIAEILRNSQLI